MTAPSRISLWHDQAGAVFAEFAIMLPVIVLVVCGSVDFIFAFYQWNAAVKAVEVGARIAAVSDPVAPGLNQFSNQAVLNGAMPGTVMPAFIVTCRKESCTCVGACVGLVENSFNEQAMHRIVFGRGKRACGQGNASYYMIGMCDILPAITPNNVVIVYKQTGLGYAGRPGGPLPTIQVSLENMDFRLFFLNSLLGAHIAMPLITTTITAEDLCSGVGSACGS
jgi:TadE-like protein